MGRLARPNDPCPCGSDRKFKKCCGASPNDARGVAGGARASYSAGERASALDALHAFTAAQWHDEAALATQTFWGVYAERRGELPRAFAELSLAAEQAWFAFDWKTDDDRRIVELLLEQTALGPGQRAFLRALRDSSQRLYEVVDAVPGRSITLEDIVEGGCVTVRERSGSRTITQRDVLAARVVACGISGQPEMELGVLQIPPLYRERVIVELDERRAEFVEDWRDAPITDFYEDLPPWFHEVWLGSIFAPAVPELVNKDGETLVSTRSVFDVVDEPMLTRCLDGAVAAGFTHEHDGWDWIGAARDGSDVVLATLRLAGGSLVVETNSVRRSERARAAIERVAAACVRHRATTHDDMGRQVRESFTARILSGEWSERGDDDVIPSGGIDPDMADAIVLDAQARHYRAWIETPLEALEGRSPRDAAAQPEAQPRLIGLLRDLGAMYQTALRSGSPAYDPSWMWVELGLEPANAPATPPPIGHERVDELFPGCGEATRAAADRVRSRKGFDDAATVVSSTELALDLDVQRWIRSQVEAPPSHPPRLIASGAPPLEGYAALLVNFELHRRKLFWVDATLAYLFDHTDVELEGAELRAPFPSCAFVFTDRHVLGLAERTIARDRGDPLHGQILRVVTAFVTETGRGGPGTLDVSFAVDALGADPPSLRPFRIPADPHLLADFLADVAQRPLVDPPVRDASPVRALLRVLINALRYCTSASVTTETRRSPAPVQRQGSAHTHASDSVYYLPGKIDIRHLHQLQSLHRISDGRQALARFMVRGHWRRARGSWSDQRPRWIEPYWKGPDLAAVIEKAYRLRGPDDPRR